MADDGWEMSNQAPIKRQPMEYVSLVAAWLLLFAFLVAGAVDIMLGYLKADVPSVSDWIHYTFSMHPWLAALCAGLAYHLLVGRPTNP